jgi:hypothetical protein
MSLKSGKSILFNLNTLSFCLYAHKFKHYKLLFSWPRPRLVACAFILSSMDIYSPDPNWVQTGETCFHPERSWKDRETTQQHQSRWCTHRFNYANSQGFVSCVLGHFFTNNNYLPVLYYLNNVSGGVFICITYCCRAGSLKSRAGLTLQHPSWSVNLWQQYQAVGWGWSKWFPKISCLS